MSRFVLIAIVLGAVLAGAFFTSETGEAGSTITVNTTDIDNDGTCGALPTHDCTLREALTFANNNDTVAFNIPTSDPDCTGAGVCTIHTGTSDLPEIADNGVTVDGYTQPGASENTLDVGDNAVIKIELEIGQNGEGLSVVGDNVTIRGLSIYGSHLQTNGYGAISVQYGADATMIAGNFIGLRAAGGDGDNDDAEGIYSIGTNLTVGSTDPADRNVISGLKTGIYLRGSGGTIVGNYIGTNPAGTAGLGNDVGITVYSAADVQIGQAGAVTGRNVISGNGKGVYLEGFIGGAMVEGNYIGLSASGTNAIPNTDGVYVSTPDPGNHIGGVNAGNIISGNETGVRLTEFAANTLVEGNRIGTNPAGTAAIGNDIGVYIDGASDAVIGGTIAGTGNVISGNNSGIYLDGNAEDNAIRGNLIGLNASGTGAIPANSYGITVNQATGTTIGGGQAAARNIVSGNGQIGVFASAGQGTTIERNYIGTNPAGTAAIPNGVGGVVAGGSDTQVKLNLISGNGGYGILMSGSNSVIQGNVIGLGSGGGALSNTGDGILVNDVGTGRIENIPSGAPNIIANNGSDGIDIGGSGTSAAGTVTSAVEIHRNSIFSNAGLGIDIAPNGVTANDNDDVDIGPNGGQNRPELTLAQRGSTLIKGSLESTPNRSFLFEMYTVAACDGSGYGEGAVYGGAANLATDGDGQIDFAVLSPANAVVGSFVTGTVTDLTEKKTSEFSNCVEVEAAPAPTVTPTGQTPTPTPIVIETPGPTVSITEAPTPTPSPTPTATPVSSVTVTPPPSATATATVTPEPTDQTSTATASSALTPTATPATQTPEPTGSAIRRMGDSDCSGQVRPRDMLMVLLFLGGFDPHGYQPCPEIEDNFGSIMWGDLDCDSDVDEDDALIILLWLADLDPDQNDPCVPIGDPISV